MRESNDLNRLLSECCNPDEKPSRTMDQLFIMGQKSDNSDHKLGLNLILSMVLVTPSNNVFRKISSLYFMKNKALMPEMNLFLALSTTIRIEVFLNDVMMDDFFFSLFEPKYLLIEHF